MKKAVPELNLPKPVKSWNELSMDTLEEALKIHLIMNNEGVRLISVTGYPPKPEEDRSVFWEQKLVNSLGWKGAGPKKTASQFALQGC